MLKNKTDKEVIEILSNLLDECLSSANQEQSFEVIEYNRELGKFVVEFDVVEVEADDYIGFQGY